MYVKCGVLSSGVQRSADPNLVWDQHFNSSCSQQQPQQTSTANAPLCTKCQVKLGPSNTFGCPKCASRVCMSHRMPEDHDCVAIRRTQMGSRRPSTDQSKSKNLVTDASASVKVKTSSRGMPPDPNNTLKGTAHMRAQRLGVPSVAETTKPTSTGRIQCPICSAERASVEEITQHIELDHLGGGQGSTAGSTAVADNTTEHRGTSREVCPQCGLSFEDLHALISHVESVHGPVTNDGGGSMCVLH